MSVIDKKLRSLVQTNEAARLLFQSVLGKKRARSVTHIARYRRSLNRSLPAGKPLDNTEYMKLWNELSRLGVGKLVQAGKSTQFFWGQDIRKVAKIALSEAVLAQKPAVEVDATDVTPAADWQTVQVKLRLGGSAVIVVPKNFTKEDVGAVAEHLQGIAS